ncbi:MAG: hypothetical protein ACRDFS_13435 [Chloroflexota bacterium]
MLRRLSLALLVASAALTLSTTVFARSHARVVAQRTAGKHSHAVYLTHSLTPKHHYRIEISAHGHHKFSGFGIEDYTFLNKGHLFSGHKSLTLRGKTTRYLTVKQPRGGLGSWQLAVDVSVLTGSELTVRFIDQGR